MHTRGRDKIACLPAIFPDFATFSIFSRTPENITKFKSARQVTVMSALYVPRRALQVP
jgi:hypothetical protein